MPGTPAVGIIGDAFLDIVCLGLPTLPVWGGDSRAIGGIVHSPGGSALNVSVHLKSLSCGEVTLFTGMGKGDWARSVLEKHLRSNGVGLRIAGEEGTLEEDGEGTECGERVWDGGQWEGRGGGKREVEKRGCRERAREDEEQEGNGFREQEWHGGEREEMGEVLGRREDGKEDARGEVRLDQRERVKITSSGKGPVGELIGLEVNGDRSKSFETNDKKCETNHGNSPSVQTGICIVLSGSKDRSFVTAPGAVEKLSRRDLNVSELAKFDHLHFGGLYALNSFVNDLSQFMLDVREVNPKITMSLDTNFDATGNWGAPWLRKAMELCDVVKFNDVEAKGVFIKNRLESEDENTKPICWLASLLRAGGIAIETRGEDGVAYVLRENSSKVNTHPNYPTESIDPVGAGDSFMAGFLADWLVDRDDVPSAIATGSACGAFAVSQVGACTLAVTRAHVKAIQNSSLSNKRLKSA